MNIRFEELTVSQRAGGIESATVGLVRSLEARGVTVFRSSQETDFDQKDRPDCVHFHGIWSPALAKRWRYWRARGTPCVISTHGMLEPWALAHKRLKKKVAWYIYQRPILNRVSVLHATSEREAENLRKLGLTAAVHLIPWGIQMPGGGSQMSEPREMRLEKVERWKEDRGVRTALFVGRIYPVKGLPMLVEAWANVLPSGWKMKIVGPDEAGHLVEVEELVRKNKLDAVFEFTGAMEGGALQRAYEEADLFILPSHTENFSMVVGEALAHGIPVITTHGAPWQLLEIECCGWWVPVSVEGIAAALEDATGRSPEDLAAMGALGRRVVADRFAWDGIARQFIECYEWVLGRGPKPGSVRG